MTVRSRRSRGARRPGARGASRVDRAAHKRRRRASTHLHRLRQRNAAGSTARRAASALLFALGLYVGTIVASPVVESTSRWWRPEPIPLRSIEIQGHSVLDSRAVAQATGIPKGSDYDSVDVREVEEHLTGHPWIRSARALRLPVARLGHHDAGSRILVRIEERKPVAVVRSEASGELRWVDASGTLFATATEEEAATLPLLIAKGPLADGESRRLLARAVALAESMPQHGIAGPVSLRLPGAGDRTEGWVVRPADGEVDVVLGSGDLRPRLERFAQLMEERPDLVSHARRVDLRFADRVVLQGGTASGGGGNKRR